MKKRELKVFLKKHPEVCSISFDCYKFPRWKDLSSHSKDLSSHSKLICQSTNINQVSVFFHLREKK